MSYLPHQVTSSDEVYAVLKKFGLCLLAGETRTGKTRTAIRVVEISKVKNALVITKKAAISGWQSELDAVKPTKDFTVTNYEQVSKLTQSFDLEILDESHNLASRGKPTKRYKDIRKVAKDCPVICLSGTPSVESLLGFYYQFTITKYSPFAKIKSFYDFFRVYGKPSPIRLHGRWVETYTKANDTLWPVVKPYIVKLTQDAAGITHKAKDIVHRVPLDDATIDLINELKADGVGYIGSQQVAFESDMKERVVVHQIETGAVKIDDKTVLLPNTEMVDYIRKKFGDSPDVAIMCHYHATRDKVKKHLPKCHVYSSDGHAEGVNLSHYKHFVILNTGYSGAKHVQRRDRIVNINRTTEANVHIMVAEGQLSELVYEAVKDKHDFNLSMYRRLK